MGFVDFNQNELETQSLSQLLGCKLSEKYEHNGPDRGGKATIRPIHLNISDKPSLVSSTMSISTCIKGCPLVIRSLTLKPEPVLQTTSSV